MVQLGIHAALLSVNILLTLLWASLRARALYHRKIHLREWGRCAQLKPLPEGFYCNAS